ncbi:MAG: multidrug effflux MFS transporter [Heliomarina sp.]|uniref:multidrug effflux MFS transporter n=1 Tax=Heliomarina sp. TaxID=2917556 RepID=UPI004059C7F9
MERHPVSRYLDRKTVPHVSTLILVTGLAALAMNVFLPSLPGMTEYFHTEYRVMQLSVALYLGFNAILQVLIGPISDKFGRRPLIVWGIALFLLATLGCIYSPTAEIFLFFRMCQSVVAVAMVLSRAAVRDMFDTDRAASMIGYVTMGMAVVPMIGPAFGGVLDEIFGWKSTFWALFLIGILTLVVTYYDFGETAMKSGKTLGQQFREYPELLTSPRFWGYSLAAAFTSGSFFAYLGGAPYVGSEVFHLTPSELGVYFGAPAVGYFIGNFITARCAVRFGINKLVLWGGIMIFAGITTSTVITMLGHANAYTFFGFMCFVGLGNGMTIPNATAGSLSVRPHLAGTASGLGGALMLGGGAALSAFAGMMLKPGVGPLPLLFMMMATTALGICSILLVIYRERQLGLR